MSNWKSCDKYNTCANRDKCGQCVAYRLFRDTKNISKVSGTIFENHVVNQYNKLKKQLASGGAFHKGDLIDQHFLMECKLRTIKSNGKQQITIKKEWLNKISNEARGEGGRVSALPFGFKEDEEVYIVITLSDLVKISLSLDQGGSYEEFKS